MSNNSTLYLTHEPIYPILFPVIFIGFLIGVLNVYTISIITRSKTLCRPANFPIVSILLGATIQGVLTAPTYVFKRLDESVLHESNRRWVCDFYRLPYFLCGHTLKVSLMIVSFDRLIAIKFPYRYGTVVTKRLMISAISISWLVVVVIDVIPFFPFGKESDDEGCTYVPTKIWGISVITIFNIIPFTAVAINYLIIWRAAARITFKDYDQQQIACSTANSSSEDLYNTGSYETSRRPSEQEGGKLSQPDILNINAARKISRTRMTLDLTDLMQASNNKERKKSPTPRKKLSLDSLNNLKDKVLASPILNGRGAVMLKLALEMKATKTSFTLLVVYLLCWGPLGLFFLLDHYCSSCLSRVEDHSSTRFIIKVVSFSSSLFLPSIYCWRTKEFRSEICRFTCEARYRKNKLISYYKKNGNQIPQIKFM